MSSPRTPPADPPPPAAVPPAERAVLGALWADAPRTAREIARAVYGADGPSPTATVQTLLTRLERRGLVARDRAGRAHRFAPAVSREELAGAELVELAERVAGGSLAPVVTHLIDAGRLSEADLAPLRAALAAHDARRDSADAGRTGGDA